MPRCPLDDGGGSESDSRRAQFAERDEALLSLVPEREGRAPQALKERQPTKAGELRMIAKDPADDRRGCGSKDGAHGAPRYYL